MKIRVTEPAYDGINKILETYGVGITFALKEVLKSTLSKNKPNVRLGYTGKFFDREYVLNTSKLSMEELNKLANIAHNNGIGLSLAASKLICDFFR